MHSTEVSKTQSMGPDDTLNTGGKRKAGEITPRPPPRVSNLVASVHVMGRGWVGRVVEAMCLRIEPHNRTCPTSRGTGVPHHLGCWFNRQMTGLHSRDSAPAWLGSTRNVHFGQHCADSGGPKCPLRNTPIRKS